MADDWIKMRTNLRRHPKVVRMASALEADKCPDKLRIVGALHAVWSVFDEQSVDGVLVGYTPSALDDEIRWPGFTAILISVGWCEDTGESLVLPEFGTHNGQSAKRRAQDADRKRSVRSSSASQADKLRTREEKRREEKKKEQTATSTAAPSTDLLGQKNPPADLTAHRAERLAQVTTDAIETFNASKLVKPNGGALATVHGTVGRPKRQTQVQRCIATAREICKADYASDVITREFWADYWATVEADDFASGRQRGGKGHEGWLPDFEYLTRPATMLKLYDRAASEDAA